MRPLALTAFLFLLTSCGYVGPVQPPSPEIPSVITNLAAVERGDKIIINFTTPARTTDGVAITQFSLIDLRLFAATQAPESAPSIEVQLPPAGSREDPQPDAITYSADVDAYSGQLVAICVRTAIRKTGHLSGWSNRAVLQIVTPLAQPVVALHPSAAGVVLSWPASSASQFQILRQSGSEKQPVEIASVNENRYTDISAQPDTDYRYIVVARKGTAESVPSEPGTIRFPDVYPPMVPSGLTAQAGPDAIDLAWQRNTEPDLQGYYVYRSVDHGTFDRLGALVTLPSYTDRAVEHGKSYAYKVSAIDKKSNASAESSSAEVPF